jgi:hypothetical protein
MTTSLANDIHMMLVFLTPSYQDNAMAILPKEV